MDIEVMIFWLVAYLAIFLPATLPWKKGSFLFLGGVFLCIALTYVHFISKESGPGLHSLIPTSLIVLAIAGLFLISMFLRVTIIALDPKLSGHTKAIPVAPFWLGAALALALSLFGASWFLHLAIVNGSYNHGVASVAIALIGLAFCLLLTGVAIRRTNAASRRA